MTFTRAEADQLLAAIGLELDARAAGTQLDRLVAFYDTPPGRQDDRHG